MQITTKKEMYNDFHYTINSKVEKLNAKLDELTNSMGVIIKFKLMDDPRVKVIINKILDRKISSDIYIDFDRSVGNVDLIMSYLKSILRYTKEIDAVKLDIDRYTKFNICEQDFTTLLETISFEASKEILRNEKYNLGNSLGILFIQVKKRYFGSRYNNRVVNWKESLDRLLYLSTTTNKETKDMGDRYVRKLVSKTEFIDFMKPYVWSANTPDLPKWLIFYTDDSSVWWHWIKKYINIPNQALYSFEPTNHINIANSNGIRSQLSIAATMSEDEIIETKKLGNRDKANCLFTKDKSYFIYSDNGIQND